MVESVLAKWNRIDILVNNAGITRDKSLRKMAVEDWTQVINVNLNGTYYCTSAVLPTMIEQKFGRIINITSVIGQGGGFGQANYAASKGGITAFTKTLALEMAKFNITANCIAPGYTETDMVAAVPENVLAKIRAMIPLGRLAKPDRNCQSRRFPRRGWRLHHRTGDCGKRRVCNNVTRHSGDRSHSPRASIRPVPSSYLPKPFHDNGLKQGVG